MNNFFHIPANSEEIGEKFDSLWNRVSNNKVVLNLLPSFINSILATVALSKTPLISEFVDRDIIFVWTAMAMFACYYVKKFVEDYWNSQIDKQTHNSPLSTLIFSVSEQDFIVSENPLCFIKNEQKKPDEIIKLKDEGKMLFSPELLADFINAQTLQQAGIEKNTSFKLELATNKPQLPLHGVVDGNQQVYYGYFKILRDNEHFSSNDPEELYLLLPIHQIKADAQYKVADFTHCNETQLKTVKELRDEIKKYANKIRNNTNHCNYSTRIKKHGNNLLTHIEQLKSLQEKKNSRNLDTFLFDLKLLFPIQSDNGINNKSIIITENAVVNAIEFIEKEYKDGIIAAIIKSNNDTTKIIQEIFNDLKELKQAFEEAKSVSVPQRIISFLVQRIYSIGFRWYSQREKNALYNIHSKLDKVNLTEETQANNALLNRAVLSNQEQKLCTFSIDLFTKEELQSLENLNNKITNDTFSWQQFYKKLSEKIKDTLKKVLNIALAIFATTILTHIGAEILKLDKNISSALITSLVATATIYTQLNNYNNALTRKEMTEIMQKHNSTIILSKFIVTALHNSYQGNPENGQQQDANQNMQDQILMRQALKETPFFVLDIMLLCKLNSLQQEEYNVKEISNFIDNIQINNISQNNNNKQNDKETMIIKNNLSQWKTERQNQLLKQSEKNELQIKFQQEIIEKSVKATIQHTNTQINVFNQQLNEIKTKIEKKTQAK